MPDDDAVGARAVPQGRGAERVAAPGRVCAPIPRPSRCSCSTSSALPADRPTRSADVPTEQIVAAGAAAMAKFGTMVYSGTVDGIAFPSSRRPPRRRRRGGGAAARRGHVRRVPARSATPAPEFAEMDEAALGDHARWARRWCRRRLGGRAASRGTARGTPTRAPPSCSRSCSTTSRSCARRTSPKRSSAPRPRPCTRTSSRGDARDRRAARVGAHVPLRPPVTRRCRRTAPRSATTCSGAWVAFARDR